MLCCYGVAVASAMIPSNHTVERDGREPRAPLTVNVREVGILKATVVRQIVKVIIVMSQITVE